MAKAFGIVNFAGNRIWVDGLQDYRPIGAFTFLGRYRLVDFPISNMSNSGIEHVQVYIKSQPRAIVEHLGSGRHYNINSKRGRIHMLFSGSGKEHDLYTTDMSAYADNLENIENLHYSHVVIAPSYMVYTQNYDTLLQEHLDSGADITLLYHSVDNAKEYYLSCDTLNLNRQKGVESIEPNRGNAKNKNIFMDTYVMSRDLFIELIKRAKKLSSLYTLADVINASINELDVRAVSHRGFFASITEFKSYYDANLQLIDFKTASNLFDDEWPIYTRTNDSAPTQYSKTASIKNSVVSNGCTIEGTVENCVIGRGTVIKRGAYVKNCVILPDAVIGDNVHLENIVMDRYAKVTRVKSVVAPEDNPGYIKRKDVM